MGKEHASRCGGDVSGGAAFGAADDRALREVLGWRFAVVTVYRKPPQ
jgi:hypothetical protein